MKCEKHPKILFFFCSLYALIAVTGACNSNSSTSTFTIGGTITGLNATVVLQNNSADNLSISSDGSFTFATALANGATYSVSILSQADGQTCSVSNATGTISNSNITNVTVACSDSSFTVGGTVSGLTGTVVLQNSTENLPVSTDGSFIFPSPVADGATYEVTVLTQPDGQTCTPSNNSGTIAGENISNVTVTCTDNIKQIFIANAFHNGNLGGISGADTVCMNAATYPGTGDYKAFLVDGSTRIACTTADCSGGKSENADWALAPSTTYIRADDNTITIGKTNAAGIFDFPLENAFGTGPFIWTGLETDWTSAVDNCSAWTANFGSGIRGNFGNTDVTAIHDASMACVSSITIACVEQ